MACAKQIGLTRLPIVCVNVDGYYENFRQMLNRAYEDELTYLKPHEILHFEPTAEAAVRWIEEQAAQGTQAAVQPKVRRRESVLGRSSSFMSPPVGDWGIKSGGRGGRASRFISEGWGRWAVVFAAGLSVGVMVATQSIRSKA